MMKRLIILLAMLCMVSLASAAPTTSAATSIGNNNFTFQGTGSADPGWFQWGMAAGQSWAKTPNITPSGGAISYTMRGSPVYGCTSYYYRACDATGCGSEVSFMTTAVTALPVITYGAFAENITENRFDPGNVFWNAMRPYTTVTGDTVFYGLIFAMVFVGAWLRTRGTAMATQFGMLCSALFVSSAVGLQLGLPPEFVAVGQAVMYISLASAVMAFTFR